MNRLDAVRFRYGGSVYLAVNPHLGNGQTVLEYLEEYDLVQNLSPEKITETTTANTFIHLHMYDINDYDTLDFFGTSADDVLDQALAAADVRDDILCGA